MLFKFPHSNIDTISALPQAKDKRVRQTSGPFRTITKTVVLVVRHAVCVVQIVICRIVSGKYWM